jgi:hypothetical protein
MEEASSAPADVALIDLRAGNPAVVSTPGRLLVTDPFFSPFPAWYAACVLLELPEHTERGRRSAMTTTSTSVVKCPECGSHDEMLRHDPRASLVYACKVCLHEWQIDPADEPRDEVPAAAERPRPPAGSAKRSGRP